MFHRLVGGAVFTHRNTVMGKYIDNRQFHQSRQSNGRSTVVGEHQKGSAVRAHPFVKCHAGHNGAHGMFPHAETDITTGVRAFLEIK